MLKLFNSKLPKNLISNIFIRITLDVAVTCNNLFDKIHPAVLYLNHHRWQYSIKIC